MIPGEYLFEIFKVSPLPSLLVLPDAPRFTIKEVNSAYLMATGAKEADLIDKGFFEAFPEDPDNLAAGILENVRDSLEQVRLTKQPHKIAQQRFTIPVPGTKNSGEKYFALENIPVLNGTDAVEYIVQYAVDITERILSEQKTARELANAKDQFQLLLRSIDSTDEGLFVIDKDGLCTFINTAAAQMLGYEKEACLGKNLHALIHYKHCTGQPYAETDCPIYRNKDQPQGCQIEGEVFWRANGSSFEVRYSTRPIIDHGIQKGAVIAFTDITEYNKATRALQQSEESLQKIFAQSLDIICTIDEAGKFVRVSAAAEKIWGYKIHELIGKRYMDLVYPEDHAETQVVAAGILAGLEMTIFENRYIRKDGSLVPIYWSAHWDDKEKIMYCIARDATEMKKAKAEASERQFFIETAIENLPIGIAVTKIDDRSAIHLNKNFGEIYGWPIEELKDVDSFSTKVLPNVQGRNEMKARFMADIQSGDIDRMSWEKIPITTQSGEERIINAKNIPVYSQNLMISTVVDVTDEVKLEEQKEFEKRDKEALINSTDDLIWSVSSSYKLIAANKAFIQNYENLTGTTLQPGDDMILRGILPEEYLVVWEEFYKKALSGESFKKEIYWPTINKREEFWSEINFNPIHQNDAVVAIACHSRDTTERKIAEVKIRQSEAHLLEAQKLARIGSWIFDYKTRKLSWSEELYNVFGADRKTFILTNKSFRNLIEPADRDIVLQASRSTRETGEPYTIEYQIIAPNGERRFIMEFGYGQKDSNGSVVRLFGTAQDITERKKAEQALRISNERYELLAKVTNDAIWDWDLLKNEILRPGKKLENLLGYNEVEAPDVDEFWSRHVHPEDWVKMQQTLKTLFENPAQHFLEGEYRFRKADGQYAYVDTKAYIIRDKDGKAIRMVGASKNITKEKEQINEIIGIQQNLDSLINTTSDLIWSIDPDFKIIAANKAFKDAMELLGGIRLKEGDLVIPSFSDEITNKWTALYNRALAGESFSIEQSIYKPTLKDYWHNIVSLSPIIGNDGHVLGVACFANDITELKKSASKVEEMNLTLQRKAEELAISNTELEQFAYVASHDLQEPLRMITNFLTQLEKKYGNIIDEKGKKYIYFAVDGAKRMRQIILDLLEFSRVGRMEYNREDLDLNQLVKEINTLFRNKIEGKNAVIQVGKLPVINAYKAPLRQVFQNLISNALKYTRKNILPQIQITAGESATHWQFAVADNGIGIEEEYFEKIFIIFQRLHNKQEYSGTGMGLAVTKKIVENLGGKIWVTSQEGVGSTFYFTIKKQV